MQTNEHDTGSAGNKGKTKPAKVKKMSEQDKIDSEYTSRFQEEQEDQGRVVDLRAASDNTENVELNPHIADKEEVPERTMTGYPLAPPNATIINGSGFVTLQMFRRGAYMTAKGIWIPGSGLLDIADKYKSPIPSDAVWFIVDYDMDINLKYRKEKLKLLGLNEESRNGNMVAKVNAHDNAGNLDMLRIGDEVLMNNENFIPVKMNLGIDIYYRVHYMDILAIRKHFPRDAFEAPSNETQEANSN